MKEKTTVLLIVLLSAFCANGQRMLVLPDTPRYANQNKGVWVLRLADTLPYWSNGRKWIMNASGASALQIRDSLAAYNLRNVTAFNGKVGSVRGVDSIYFTGNDMSWRYNNTITTQSIGGNWYNVKQNGGDNTGATDVSGIVNAALNSGVKDIYFPKGRYRISSPIQLKDGCTLYGDGRGITTIVINGNISGIVGGHAKGGYGSQISNISIEGTKSGGATSAQIGIYLDSVAKVLVHNVFITNIGGAGIYVLRNGYCCGSYTATATRGNTFSDCYIENSGIGIYLKEGTTSPSDDAEYNKIIGCTLHGNVVGARIGGGNNTIASTTITYSSSMGLYLTGGSNNGHGIVEGCTINHNFRSLYIDGATKGVSMTGNNIHSEDSIVVRGSSYVNIVGGWFYAPVVYYDNSTNCVISATSTLAGNEPTITVGTGETPTYIKAGKADNTLSWIDAKNSKEFAIGHTNGVVTFTGLGTAGMDTTDYKPMTINPTTKEVRPLSYWPSGSGGGGSGTVTSVATNTGSGITGGTITTSGTLAIDTFKIATRARVQKGIDSLGALIGAGGGTNYWTIGGGNLYNNSGTNVGIGTTAPLSKLHVSGSVRLGDTLLLNDGGYAPDYLAGLVKVDAPTIRLRGVYVEAGSTHPGGNFRFFTNGGFGLMTSGGQFSLSSYSPTPGSKLHVQGNTQITGNLTIGSATAGTSVLSAVGLPVFADNTAAASLSVGDFYRTSTGQVMVRY